MEKERIVEKILKGIHTVHRERPLVHMIPNYVTAALCADAISAVGARPLMAQAAEEMEEITSFTDGLVVNLGQPSGEKYLACGKALETAAHERIPVVFDPVGAGASKFRRDMTARLSELPWSGVIKGNSAELHTILTGGMNHDGVDSLGSFEHVREAEQFVSRMTQQGRNLVIAETGTVDKILWRAAAGGKVQKIFLHHEKRRPVVLVGTGCMAGAVMGALVAGNAKAAGDMDAENLAILAAAAISLVSFCGESMGECGYGTYKAGLLDALSRVEEERYREYLQRTLEV